jgi:hypothetical protein
MSASTKKTPKKECAECGLLEIVGTCKESKQPHCLECCRENRSGLNGGWRKNGR